jgi:hypothetical protein
MTCHLNPRRYLRHEPLIALMTRIRRRIFFCRFHPRDQCLFFFEAFIWDSRKPRMPCREYFHPDLNG